MPPSTPASIEAFKTLIQTKIKTVLDEFAQGKLSREQFQTVYAHYDAQLQIAEAALGDQHPLTMQTNTGETMALKQAHMGKAIGMLIYHNKSAALIDTLGAFEGGSALLHPLRADFALALEGRLSVPRRVVKTGGLQWLLLTTGQYTTVITLFQNEPAQLQVAEIERLHHDFEIANGYFLATPRVDAGRLAYPFLVFVQQKLKRKD